MKTKATKLDLLANVAKMRHENSVLYLALADAVNGAESKTFKGGRYSLTVSRPTSACGGVVTVKAEGSFVGAHYFEDYARSESEHIGRLVTGENNDYNRELLSRRDAISEAVKWRNERLNSKID